MADARGYSARAGQQSLARARASGQRYASFDQMSPAERAQMTEEQRILSYYAPPNVTNGIRNRTVYNVHALESQARSDLLRTGYSEIYPEITTFFQNIKNLPQAQQDSIMSNLRAQANASVDKAFDSEAGFISAVRAAKLKNYDDQLALIKKGEDQALQKELGILGKGASDSVRTNYYNQFQGNVGDSGQLSDFANRIIEQYDLQSKQEKDASALAIQKAQQQRDAASDITNLNAESDLQDLAYQRTAAQQQRLSQLMGLNAQQDLLLQTPTATQTTITGGTGAPIARSGSFVRSPYGARTSQAGIAANARAGFGTTARPSTTRSPFGNRRSTAGIAANSRSGYFLP